MSCYTPLSAFRTRNGISFHQNDDENLYEIKLPCGSCIGCRLEYARQWSVRITHEASLHEQNCFLTLTYDNEHLNNQQSLDKSDPRAFFKRLRQWAHRQNVKHKRKIYGKLGFFMCGEYGENKSRPHYHACLFNFDFPDKSRIEDSRSGHPQFESEILTQLWSMGRATIGALTKESAAYTAGYVTKKIRGNNASDYYGDLVPEYTACSRRPAIGLDWIKKYYTDIYNYDTCMVDGKTQRPPRYYDKYLEKTFPDMMLDIRMNREYNMCTLNTEDQTEERLNVKHKCALAKHQMSGMSTKTSGDSIRHSRGSDPFHGYSRNLGTLSDAQQLYDQRVVAYREE